MSGTNVSQMTHHDETTTQQTDLMVRPAADDIAQNVQCRFPSVDSVISDIDAKWETNALVA